MNFIIYRVYYNIFTVLIIIKRLNCINQSILSKLSINNRSLSITSFTFNENKITPDYLSTIFGDKAIFLHKEMFNDNDANDYDQYQANLNNNHEWFKRNLPLTIHDFTPECYFEILGFTYISPNNNEFNPFSESYRDVAPIVGKGMLNIRMIQHEPINCYYRGLFENWKADSFYSRPNYWTTLVYCPVIDINQCNNIIDYRNKNNNDIETKMKLTIYLHQSNYNTYFSVYMNKDFYNYNIPSIEPSIGICVAIPFIYKDKEKSLIESTMLVNWIRYYIKLGLTVFVYDHNGNSRKYIDSIVNEANNNYLVYHNYTIGNLLNSNIEKSNYIADYIGSDLQYTMTQCRFEAKVKYNIRDIIIANYDEFLYCPLVGSSANNQSEYIHNLIAYEKSIGYDQIMFNRRILMNTTNSMKDCLLQHIRSNSSIFLCLSSYNYITSYHSIKSLHIGMKCPMTGEHSACPISRDTILSHDCICNSKYYDNICQFIYFNTNDKLYNNNNNNKYFNQSTIYDSINELELVMKSNQ